MATSSTRVDYDASRYDEAGFSTASSTNPAGISQRYTELSGTNDLEGTTTARRYEETGKPVLEATTQVPPGQVDDGRVDRQMEQKINEISDFENRPEFGERPAMGGRFLSDDAQFGQRPDPFAQAHDPFANQVPRGHQQQDVFVPQGDVFDDRSQRGHHEPQRAYEPQRGYEPEHGQHSRHDHGHSHSHSHGHGHSHALSHGHTHRHDHPDPIPQQVPPPPEHRQGPFHAQPSSDRYDPQQGYNPQDTEPQRPDPFAGQSHSYQRQDPFVKRDEHFGGREDPFASQEPRTHHQHYDDGDHRHHRHHQQQRQQQPLPPRGFGGEESMVAEEGLSRGPAVKKEMHREYYDVQETNRQRESDQVFEQLMEDEYAKREGGA